VVQYTDGRYLSAIYPIRSWYWRPRGVQTDRTTTQQNDESLDAQVERWLQRSKGPPAHRPQSSSLFCRLAINSTRPGPSAKLFDDLCRQQCELLKSAHGDSIFTIIHRISQNSFRSRPPDSGQLKQADTISTNYRCAVAISNFYTWLIALLQTFCSRRLCRMISVLGIVYTLLALLNLICLQ